MEDKKNFLEITDKKDCKELFINGVDASRYLVTYSITSTPSAKDIVLRFRIPDDKIKILVD